MAVASWVTGATFATIGAAVTAGAWGFVAIASAVAIGASYVVSRIINGNMNKGGLGASQGGRIQTPPATNNKIPVVYGTAFVNGIVTDARLISTDQKNNDVMYYCLVISENTNTTSSNTFTVEDIYWNDLRLEFETTAGNQHKVARGVKTVEATPTNAGSFVVGKKYKIETLGSTDFTLIGAASNTAGVVFTATGVGTGTGVATTYEDFVDENFKVDDENLVEIRVYSRGSELGDQILPLQSTGNAYNAWDYWPDDHWTSAHQMQGLVFAVIRVKYNAEKGFTNLASVTFKLTNSVNNPADVWQDYMNVKRYGAGISLNAIDATAQTAWKNYCDELVYYTDQYGNSSTQKRYEINGVIDTARSVKENIDTIMQNGGAWLSYEVSTGLWRPIIKKAVSGEFVGSISGTTLTVESFGAGRVEAGMQLSGTGVTAGTTIVSQTFPLLAGETTGQKGRYTVSTSQTVASTTMATSTAGLLKFNDDNIISGIGISSTRLDDLYNGYEAEYFDTLNKDQRAYTRDSITSDQRNPNEPDNILRMGLDLTNNSMQADIISTQELRQSRDDLVIEFTASHYGIQAMAGDVIEVTNGIYGWAPKLFRVVRVKETERDDGALLATIEALEYNADVYTIEPLTEFTTQANIGIPNIGAGGNSGNVQTPSDDSVSIVETNNTAAQPYITLACEVPPQGGPYDELQIWYATGPDTVSPPDTNYSLLLTIKPPPPNSVFNNGRTIYVETIEGGDTLKVATGNIPHNLKVGDQVYYPDASFAGLVQNQAYWVVDDGGGLQSFKLSLTKDGTPVTLTDGVGLNLPLDTCHIVYITTLPANQPGQKYYFRVRAGVRGIYSGFTNPDGATIATPTTPYDPNGGSGGTFDMGGTNLDFTGSQDGDVIYYDLDTNTWKDTSVIQIYPGAADHPDPANMDGVAFVNNNLYTKRLVLDEQWYLDSAELLATTTDPDQMLHVFRTDWFRSCKYQLQITQGTNIQVMELLVMHDNVNVYNQVYADMKNGSTDLATFTFSIIDATLVYPDMVGFYLVKFGVTPTTANTDFRLAISLIE